MFRYIFDADYKFGGLARLELKPIAGPFELFGKRFEPIPIIHGETEIYGYRFGSAAYLTDFSEIPEASLGVVAGAGRPVPGRVAAQTPPYTFDGGKLDPDC